LNIPHPHQDRRTVCEPSKPPLSFLEAFLGAPILIDVENQRDPSVALAIPAKQRRINRMNPAPADSLVEDPALIIHVLTGEGALEKRPYCLDCLGPDDINKGPALHLVGVHSEESRVCLADPAVRAIPVAD